MAYNPDSFAHKAERKGVELLVDAAIKHTNKDRQKAMMQFIDLAQKFIGDTWDPAAYDRMRDAIATTDTKWYKYISGLFDDITPKQMKALAVNVGYEAGIRGYKQTRQMAEKYNCNVPWVILMDPTSACNLRCTGCWAAEYGHTLALTYEELESIVKQGRELGIHAYVMTGGEPMMRKKDIIRLAEEFQDCYFLFYTNGTLIDEEFCKEMVRVGNVSPNISIEGFEEANDSRRGKGTFDKIMHAMDLMKEYKCLFGASICYTSVNYKVVTSDEFLDMLIEKGCKMLWYFHYMPVGCGASTDLLLTPEEREYMIQRVRWIRGYHTGKPIMAAASQAESITCTLTRTGMWSRVSSSTIHQRTSRTRRCLRHFSSRCSWSTERISHSTTTTCSRVRCLRIRKSCAPWSRPAVQSPPIWRHRRMSMHSVTSVRTMQRSGRLLLRSSGRRSTSPEAMARKRVPCRR